MPSHSFESQRRKQSPDVSRRAYTPTFSGGEVANEQLADGKEETGGTRQSVSANDLNIPHAHTRAATGHRSAEALIYSSAEGRRPALASKHWASVASNRHESLTFTPPPSGSRLTPKLLIDEKYYVLKREQSERWMSAMLEISEPQLFINLLFSRAPIHPCWCCTDHDWICHIRYLPAFVSWPLHCVPGCVFVCVCVRALAHAAHNKASTYTGFMATALSGRGGRVLCCHLDIVVQICCQEMQSIHECTHTLNTAAGNTIPSTQRVSAHGGFLHPWSKKKEKKFQKSSERLCRLLFFKPNLSKQVVMSWCNWMVAFALHQDIPNSRDVSIF